MRKRFKALRKIPLDVISLPERSRLATSGCLRDGLAPTPNSPPDVQASGDRLQRAMGMPVEMDVATVHARPDSMGIV